MRTGGAERPISRTSETIVQEQNSQSSGPLTPEQLEKQLIEDLTLEISLYQVWRNSLRIPHDSTNLWWAGLTGAVLILYLWLAKPDAKHIAGLVRDWSDLGFNFSGTVLGFLIAGFTIFASLGQPEMFSRMAKILKKDTEGNTNGFSYLKESFFALLRAFAEYWAFGVLFLLVKLLAFENGPVSEILRLIKPVANIEWTFWAVLFIVLGVGFVYIFFVLQTFIFNVHHFVMAGIRYSAAKKKTINPDTKAN